MEAQQAQPYSRRDGRPGSNFLEERSKLRKNIEMANRTQARRAELSQQIETLLATIRTARSERSALRKSIDGELTALRQPLIGRRLPDGLGTAGPVRPQPDSSHDLAPDDLQQFLSALNDMDLPIDDVQEAMQRQDLERLKQWLRDQKNRRPPGSN